MKIKLIIFFLLFSYCGYSQSLEIADFWFNRYEYQKAAETYSQIDTKLLSQDDLLRWCYASFTSKDYNSSFKISDSLIGIGEVPAFFYYANAFSAMSLNKYEIAKSRFETYKLKDNQFFVDSLIASCEQIPTWDQEEYIKFIPFEGNSNKANISGHLNKGNLLFFNEGGVDYQRNLLGDSVLEYAELMFMRPYTYLLNERIVSPIIFPDDIQLNNIVSLAIDSTMDEAYFTMSNPLSNDPVMKVPHIYVGTFKNDTITNVHIWDYSGIDDSSSTAFATLSYDLNYLVFTKQFHNRETSDLYMSIKKDGYWTDPVLIQELATTGDDGYPLFIDDSTMSFASNGRVGYGGLDAYLTTFKNGGFSDIRHLKSPINSSADDFNLSYSTLRDTVVFTSNRIGVNDDDDIYIIQLFEIDTMNNNVKPEEEKVFEDLLVYFDFDKSNIKSSEEKKMNEYDFSMIQNVNYTVYLEGHCDNRGTNVYNDLLGEKRALSVKKKLIALGIPEDKIAYLSKGKREPVIDCVQCTSYQHSKNRVVIVKVIFNKHSQIN